MEETACGYSLRLTSIGSNCWQLFITKIDDTSDYVRVVYGITEQIGGGNRRFQILHNIIISPEKNEEPAFLYQFNEALMKNRRVWVAFETVRRDKGKKGTSIGDYISLSPVQSKWKTSIGSTTTFEVKTLDISQFKQLYSGNKTLSQGFIALLES